VPHTGADLWRTLRTGIAREAAELARADRGLREAIAAQAGGQAENPTNGAWDEQGAWQEFFLFGVVGFGDGGLA